LLNSFAFLLKGCIQNDGMCNLFNGKIIGYNQLRPLVFPPFDWKRQRVSVCRYFGPLGVEAGEWLECQDHRLSFVLESESANFFRLLFEDTIRGRNDRCERHQVTNSS